MIALERRPEASKAWTWAAPVMAVVLTMVFGGLLFAALGKDPLVAIRTIFWDPLFGEFASFYRPQLLVKGAPLVLIAIGLSFGFRAGIWNIGAEANVHILGAICGRPLREARLLIPSRLTLAVSFRPDESRAA